jgi:hypothetical protein
MQNHHWSGAHGANPECLPVSCHILLVSRAQSSCSPLLPRAGLRLRLLSPRRGERSEPGGDADLLLRRGLRPLLRLRLLLRRSLPRRSLPPSSPSEPAAGSLLPLRLRDRSRLPAFFFLPPPEPRLSPLRLRLLAAAPPDLLGVRLGERLLLPFSSFSSLSCS